jgi:hypothetical protein
MGNRDNIDQSPHELIQSMERKIASSKQSGTPAGWEMAMVEEVCIYKGQIEDIGTGHIKFRRIHTDGDKSFSQLLWAKPFNTSTQLPLKGEHVMVINGPSTTSVNGSYDDEFLPPFYYMGPIATSQDINKNTKSTAVGDDVVWSQTDNATSMQENAEAQPELGDTANTPTYGKVFIPSTHIWPLQPLEGDYIMQGRTGNSIRLSHSQINPEDSDEPLKGYIGSPWSDNDDQVDGDPILIMRNGQDVKMDDQDITLEGSPAAIWESLKGDASSIWLTSGQSINSLREIFNDTGEEGTGVATTSRLKQEGLGQLLGVSSEGTSTVSSWGKATPMVAIASDRIVLLSKEDEILLFGKSGIALAADGPITIESQDAIVIEAPEIEFRGAVKFGDNAAVDGEKLLEILQELMGEIATLKVSTAVGPGTALPSAGLSALSDRLEEFLVTGEES